MVMRPDPAVATDIFSLNLVPLPTGAGVTHAEMATNATKELFADNRILFRLKTKEGKIHDFPLSAIVNGGMIAGIVGQASSAAMHRDLANKNRTGLLMEDLYAAIDATQKQNARLNHNEAISEFLAMRGEEFDSASAA